MKRSLFWLSMLVALLWISPAQAVEMRGELILIKGPILEFDTFRREPFCESMVDFKAGEDQPNLFNYRHYNCLGRYSFTLRGEAGSTVTLFGTIDYHPERGFLIVRKRDPNLIWVDNLDQIPANLWVTREAQKGYGAYDVYFAKAPQFSQNIASIKWGDWWGQNPAQGSPPAGPFPTPEAPAQSEVTP